MKSDKNKLDKHPASKSVNSTSNDPKETTVTIAPEVVEAEARNKALKEKVESLKSAVNKKE